ncbi:MAG: acetylglutamate kinase [Gammaproteobacteria bacterium]
MARRQMQGAQINVIKLSGDLLSEENAASIIGQVYDALSQNQCHIIIVHGGALAINAGLQSKGLESRFKLGMRITDTQTLAVVQEALQAENRKFAQALDNKLAPLRYRAIGRTGCDGNLFSAYLFDEAAYGRVGQVGQVDTEAFQSFMRQRQIPVIAPLAYAEDGKLCNINADFVASSIASSLQANLLLVSKVAGVMDADGNKIEQMTSAEVDQQIENGVIQDGMIPKVLSACDSLAQGTQSVHILDGTEDQALQQILSNAEIGLGTRILATTP